LDSDKCTCACPESYNGNDCSGFDIGSNPNPDTGLSPGGIAGIIVGVAIFLFIVIILIILVLVVIVRRKGKK
jgi:hypothetical protein